MPVALARDVNVERRTMQGKRLKDDARVLSLFALAKNTT
jgi:hypothetical protein